MERDRLEKPKRIGGSAHKRQNVALGLEEDTPHLVCEIGESEVCLLRKALYGLKQSLAYGIRPFLGFKRTSSDHGVYVSEDGDDLLIFHLWKT